ncbi:O-antigen polymerase [Enterobacter sp. Bisph1]|uniref:O-antigen polymerase n=1 Tax=Enterobacter sp. Bisph1 TaxID=1274399 RepID=UPI00057BFF7A|nr:O-antigen polymerase [Enterobacter sp. Bisph1]
MSEMKGRLSFYIMLPVIVQFAMFYLCFNVTSEMFFYSLFYGGSIFFLVCFFELLFRKKINYTSLYDNVYNNIAPIDKFVLKLLGFFVIALFPLDVYFNGFKLLNPATYAEFYGVGRFIRHVTTMCWMLVPIAYIIRAKNPWVARLFIVCSILLPIMMIDRNRLLMSFFSYFVILYARFRSHTIRTRPGEFRRVKFGLYSLLILLPTIFVIIGFYRSGTSFSIDSSGDRIIYGKFPLTDFFEMMPPSFKQILLYITSPILNFTHVASTGFLNDQFLLSQISPFSRDAYPVYPFSPVLIVRFNVGTEFYPFLLYGGLPYVFIAMFFVVLTFSVVFYWFCKSQGVYAWLLFLKFAYLMLFLGFAPQFYILFNFMSVVLIFILYLFSAFLKFSMPVNTGKTSLGGGSDRK